ncbi:putative neural-cadherin 2 [Varroa jacobsoni]|uniref:putative neural-cadherin 2 n=1 Tax=Varroa jacobsoni TaxID=62625 RepID=UPI000BF7ACDD|nr:putative neural-cadherin 2 [Varroa jacobsoni]
MLDQLKVLFVLTGASTYLVSKNGMRPLTDANDTEPPSHTNGLGGMNGVGGGAYFANGTALHYDFDDTSNPFDDAFRHDSDPNYSRQNHSSFQSSESSGSAGGGSEGGSIGDFTSDFIRSKDLEDQHYTRAPDRPPTYHVELVEENDRDVPQKILQVTAPDGVAGPVVYSMEGPDVSTFDRAEDKQKFSINTTTGEVFVLRSLDRDFPEGQAEYSFTVYAEDARSHERLGSANVYVILKDLNDNAPFFPQSVYYGNVSENAPRGTPIVLNMRALEYDDPHEGTNARITYSIEQNQVNENGELIFRIDEHTGTISTAVCCLDRERNSGYSIKVVASDGDPSHKATATATIQIKDENDMSPHFVKKEWVLEIDETNGNDLPLESILDVRVIDGDLPETNSFRYKVVENAFGADKFTMITNPDGSGSLKIIKELDYEVASQRNGFNLTIMVSDNNDVTGSDPRHLDYAKVRIRLKDINDNAPKFHNPHIQITVPENTPTGTTLATFRATDIDASGGSRVMYSIEKDSDRRRHFRVGSSSGVVTLQRPLDRERSPRHHVRVMATDDGIPARTSTATLTVILSDVNDCAPRLAEDYRPVVPEHQSATKVADIRAVDDDERPNGPPFAFSIDPNAPEEVRRAFRLDNNPNGNGSAVVYSRHAFDREQQKSYAIPILIKDSGTPPLTGASTLTVIIGDKNDNRMYPGSKRILAYTLRGSKGMITMGRVHVEDADDWDSVDKSYFWENNVAHPNFNLDQSSGEIVMRNATPGSYFLKFLVYDRQHSIEVGANVTVIVREITREDVRQGGSIALRGTTADELVRIWNWETQQTQMARIDALRETLANIVKADVNHVHIYSVVQRPALAISGNVGGPRLSVHAQSPEVETEVRFFVRSLTDEHVRPELLNGLVEMNRQLLERKLQLNISQVGINECLRENSGYNAVGGSFTEPEDVCEQGSCSNHLLISDDHIVINANRTSFVGVNVTNVATCECTSRLPKNETHTCNRNSCSGRGRCLQGEGMVACECPPGYNGPNCEQTTRSFKGDGFAWFRPVETCEQLHISIEFKTSSEDGLLLYTGPLTIVSSSNALKDMLSLELWKGRPRLLIDLGGGTYELTVKTEEGLADDTWHRLDIFVNGQTAQLMVDMCAARERPIGAGYRHRGGTSLRKCLNQTLTQTTPETWSLMSGVGSSHGRDSTSSPLPASLRAVAAAVSYSSPMASLLNVKQPIQIGGALISRGDGTYNANSKAFLTEFYASHGWRHRPNLSSGFTGCVRQVVVNSQLIDLDNPVHSLNSRTGCPSEDLLCVQTRCIHGHCEVGESRDSRPSSSFTVRSSHQIDTSNDGNGGGICICQPGWEGSHCDRESQSRMLQQASFIKFALNFDPDPFRTDIQMQFRSRQREGELISFASAKGREYAILEISQRRLRFRFNLDRPTKDAVADSNSSSNNSASASAGLGGQGGAVDTERSVQLEHTLIDDGQWHTVRVRRYGCFVSLQLDDGQGPRYAVFSNELACSARLLMVDRHRVTVGGTMHYNQGGVMMVERDLMATCVRDVRLEGRVLPLEDTTVTSLADAAGFVLEARNVIRGCPSSNPCHGVICSNPFMCIDLWNDHVCRCPPGFRQSGPANCTDLDECLISSPCLNGGSCLNRPNGRGFLCQCTTRFRGEVCSEPVPVEQLDQFNMAAISALLVCSLNLIVLLLIIVAYLRARRPKTSDQQAKANQKDQNGKKNSNEDGQLNQPDIRETIIAYHDEGGGEDDMRSFDMTQLRIPLERHQQQWRQQRGRQKSLETSGIAGVDPGERQIVAGCPPRLDVLQGSSHIDITMHETPLPVNVQTGPTQQFSYVAGGPMMLGHSLILEQQPLPIAPQTEAQTMLTGGVTGFGPFDTNPLPMSSTGSVFRDTLQRRRNQSPQRHEQPQRPPQAQQQQLQAQQVPPTRPYHSHTSLNTFSTATLTRSSPSPNTAWTNKLGH